jgi:hypothetical protein
VAVERRLVLPSARETIAPLLLQICGEAQLHSGGCRPLVGRGHHLRAYLGRLALPLVRLGHLLPKARRMVNGEPPEDRAGPGCGER